MTDGRPDGWKTRLFLLLMTLLLFGGLTFLGVKLFHDASISSR